MACDLMRELVKPPPGRAGFAPGEDLGYGAPMRPFAILKRTIKTTSLAGLGGTRAYAA
jgi:hypothetical protein